MEITLLRQASYRLFASLLLYPDEKRLDSIINAAALLDGEDEAFGRFVQASEVSTAGDSIFQRWKELLHQIRSLDKLAQHILPLQEEYTRLFITSRNGFCYPYEGAHLGHTSGTQRTVSLIQIENEYAQKGLVLSINELPDHVAVELEFMSFLCGKESNAGVAPDDIQKAKEVLQSELSFLNRHLGLWFPLFARKVISNHNGIYAIVSETAEGFIKYDRDFISAQVLTG